jgi:hypothetical protein
VITRLERGEPPLSLATLPRLTAGTEIALYFDVSNGARRVLRHERQTEEPATRCLRSSSTIAAFASRPAELRSADKISPLVCR